MITIDALGKPCPIPVIEAKKALAKPNGQFVLIKVDNFSAVQNLGNMSSAYGYGFTHTELSKTSFEAIISRGGEPPPPQKEEAPSGLVVVIGRNTMGDGPEELGKILIKGFIYSLTELTPPPGHLIFLNSGAYLTSSEVNTVDDLKALEQKGVEILTCGTCVNYYGLQDKLAVGTITDMYGITEKMAAAANVINI